MRDIAAAAQVSLGTVSNVLNKPDHVTPAVRERVLATMNELGFVPSRAAGQLRSRRSSLIGVVVPDVGNPYWATVIRGIESVIEHHDLAIVVGSTHQSPARQRRLLRGLESQGVDGLIIAPVASSSSVWEPFDARRYGVVALERRPARSSSAWVSLDNVLGGHLAVRHLLDRGHRRIAFINGPRTVSWCSERRRGVLAGLAERGFRLEEALVEVEVEDLTVAEGSAAVERLLADGPLPTAILCSNDMVALGALLALRSHQIAVPDRVALVGYDDVDFAAVLAPPLTTIRQPSFETGVAAARLLLKAEDRLPGEHIEFAPELIERESSRLLISAPPV